jgi:signal transduction histidine kinase
MAKPLPVALLAVACVASVLAQQPNNASDEEKRVVALVAKAAAAVESRGRVAAFAEFRKPDSDWFHGDTYLFAYDMDLNVLLNPAFPEREGKNFAGHRDETGKPVHDEIRAVVKANRAGWVDTVIAQPSSRRAAKKRVYAVAVMIDGRPGIIGSGFYPR